MLRALLYLIASLFVFSILRAILRVIAQWFGQFSQPVGAASPRRPVVEAGGELKKDPVCGTFISAATSLKKTVKGETYYFCSAGCRDKFQAS